MAYGQSVNCRFTLFIQPTFGEENGHEEAEGDARDGENQHEKEEKSTVGFLQNGKC